MDQRLRQLQRQAAAGDSEANQKLLTANCRIGEHQISNKRIIGPPEWGVALIQSSGIFTCEEAVKTRHCFLKNAVLYKCILQTQSRAPGSLTYFRIINQPGSLTRTRPREQTWEVGVSSSSNYLTSYWDVPYTGAEEWYCECVPLVDYPVTVQLTWYALTYAPCQHCGSVPNNIPSAPRAWACSRYMGISFST